MQSSVRKELKKRFLPSFTLMIHVEFRPLPKIRNKHYHELITEFYNKTGCPIIFNTSFNLGGEPLVEDLHDAVRTLVESDIEYLYLPEYKLMIGGPQLMRDGKRITIVGGGTSAWMTAALLLNNITKDTTISLIDKTDGGNPVGVGEQPSLVLLIYG